MTLRKQEVSLAIAAVLCGCILAVGVPSPAYASGKVEPGTQQPVQGAATTNSVERKGRSKHATTTRAASVTKQKKPPPELATVVVTGSHILGRTLKNSSQPIDVLSPETLRATGAIDLSDALQSALPSINVPQGSFGDTEAFERPFELRGMSPDDTMVLVNGALWHPGALLITDPVFGQGSQPTNMNTIPLSAIDHIEVLRDGASSIYGSSAIAGVVNVILKSGAEGNSLSLTTGQYSAGDGRSGDINGSFGIPLGKKGWMRLSFDWSDQAATNRAGVNQTPGFRHLGQTFVLGIPQSSEKNLFLNMQYSLSPAVTFYAFGHFSRRTATPHVFSYYGVNSPAPFPDQQLAAESPFPNGYTLYERGVSLDNALVAGLRGDFSGWHWNISANGGGNMVNYFAKNTVNYALLADTGKSPTSFHAGTFNSKQQAFDVDVTKAFNVGWSHPLNVAFGTQWLRSGYSVSPGDPASYYISTIHPDVAGGANGFPGWTPQSAFTAARHDLAEYGQVETNLTEKLNLSLSARHSNYSDFGGNTSYAFSGRYAFSKQWALRGTISTGFLAPSLPQEHFSQINFLGLGAGNPLGLPVGIYRTGLVPPTGAEATLLGGKPLRPETSHDYTLGVVWTPFNDFMATLDVYKVRVHDQIFLTDDIPVALPSINSYLLVHGVSPDFVTMQYFVNGGLLTTKGADLVVSDQNTLGRGTLFSSLAVSYHRNTFSNIEETPEILQQLGVSGFFIDPQVTRGILADSSPRSKVVLNERYDFGNWQVGAVVTKYGSYTGYAPEDSAPPQRFGSDTLVDLSGSYFLNAWTFTLGVDNLFNRYPTQVIPADDWRGDPPGTWPYSALSPFGFSGTHYYARATLRW